MRKEWILEAYGDLNPLSDAELAKIGLLTVIESRAKFLMLVALKSVAGYSHAEFIEAERMQLRQIVECLSPMVREIDQELAECVDNFERQRLASHDVRHKYVHALWGLGEGDAAVARDIRRRETLKPADLDDAIEAIATLAKRAQGCARRVIHLITNGILAEGQPPSPAMFDGSRFVRF